MSARMTAAQWRAATAPDRLLTRARDVLEAACAHVDDPRVQAWLLLDDGGAWSPLAIRHLSAPTLAADAAAAGRTTDEHAAILVARDARTVADDVGNDVTRKLKAIVDRERNAWTR